MKIGSDQWIRILKDGAEQLNLSIDDLQARQFAGHGQLLLEWNQKINLTAITDPQEVAVKHFLDAVAPSAYIPCRGHLLDMGTGAGFPGIPLKILRPDQPMTLIDSVRKKITFIKHVIRQLSLSNIQALHTRAEELKDARSEVNAISIIVCRALADLDKAVGLAVPLLEPKGRIILYRGSQTDPDLKQRGREQWQLNGLSYRKTISYDLPYGGGARSIIIFERDG